MYFRSENRIILFYLFVRRIVTEEDEVVVIEGPGRSQGKENDHRYHPRNHAIGKEKRRKKLQSKRESNGKRERRRLLMKSDYAPGKLASRKKPRN